MFKKVNDGFDWMVSFTNLEKKPDLSKRAYRLDKMFKLLELFGNPQNAYKIIHVAGSKGKGSVSSLISSILSCKGLKVGIYSSPHLLDYRERITLNHSFFKDESYIDTANEIKAKLDTLTDELPGGEPTTFELMTLAAFIIFKKEKCQWVVLETGIGGRLDSTNCVDPVASVITPIELEHCDLLGDTLEKIAFEKAGIIKKNRSVFTSNIRQNVLEVLNKKAIDCNATLIQSSKDYAVTIDSNGTSIEFQNIKCKIGLQGEIQGDNAVLAATVVKYLFPDISNKTISLGLETTSIPGRFQIVKDIVLDGAHTKDSIFNSVTTFKKIYRDGVLIFGAVKGKNINDMAEILCKNFENIIISTPGTFKESSISEICDIFEKYKPVKTIASPKDALDYARTFNKQILVTGSFYMAGEIANLLKESMDEIQ